MTTKRAPKKGQKSRKPSPKQQAPTAAEVPSNWTPLRTLPPLPSITLVFRGLLSYCNDPVTKTCEVGFHNGAPKHRPEVIIGGNHYTPRADMEFTVSNPNDLDGAYFFQQTRPFARAETDDPHDFRWIMDLESEHFHPEGVDLHPGRYRPRLFVRNGLFYTFERTTFTFKRDAEGAPVNTRPLGRVAKFMAANVYLRRNGSGTLNIDGNRLTLSHIDGVTQYIIFSNECLENNGDRCEWFRDDPDKTKRNDFFRHYEAIIRRQDQPEHLLLAVADLGSGSFLEEMDDLLGLRRRATNDAPCSGAGYGQHTGTP